MGTCQNPCDNVFMVLLCIKKKKKIKKNNNIEGEIQKTEFGGFRRLSTLYINEAFAHRGPG